MNVEVNHATLAGHTFQHELQVAADAGMLGSIDANRGDDQNGWDTDQFPMQLNELIESMLIILEAGGLSGGGVNFDAKTRRNSTDPEDLFLAHIGGMDAFARAVSSLQIRSCRNHLTKNSEKKDMLLSIPEKERNLKKENCGWKTFGILPLANGEPKQISGKQEWLENLINQYI